MYNADNIENAKQAVAEKAIARNSGGLQIDAVMYSLNLGTGIRIYLKLKEGYDGYVTVTVNEDAVDCVRQNDRRYRIKNKVISAHKLINRKFMKEKYKAFEIKGIACEIEDVIMTSSDVLTPED